MILDKHIGEQYGHFEIYSKDNTKTRSYYFLKCLNCGKIQEKSVRYDGIKNNSIHRRCDCDIDLTGQIFNYLQIVGIDKETSKKKRNTYYFCKCLLCKRDRIVSIRGATLKNGQSKSCGCLNDEAHRKNIRGQKFGSFLILDVDYEKTYNKQRIKTGTYWIGKCEKCGNLRSLLAQDLLYGKIPICGCSISMSRGEEKISQILEKLQFHFEKQKVFPDLKNTYNLKIDFYIPNRNIAIEYQGIQHYKPIEHFGGEEEFVQQQKRDNLKREYCKSHNIKLIEIPYWDYNKLDENYLKALLE